MRIISLHCQHR